MSNIDFQFLFQDLGISNLYKANILYIFVCTASTRSNQRHRPSSVTVESSQVAVMTLRPRGRRQRTREPAGCTVLLAQLPWNAEPF